MQEKLVRSILIVVISDLRSSHFLKFISFTCIFNTILDVVRILSKRGEMFQIRKYRLLQIEAKGKENDSFSYKGTPNITLHPSLTYTLFLKNCKRESGISGEGLGELFALVIPTH